MNPGSRGNQFPTTHWPPVVSAGSASDPRSEQALSVPCSACWRPIYAYIRRRGPAGPAPGWCEDLYRQEAADPEPPDFQNLRGFLAGGGEGTGYAEAAAAMGIKPETFRAAVHRGTISRPSPRIDRSDCGIARAGDSLAAGRARAAAERRSAA